jgi:hypothetical protein
MQPDVVYEEKIFQKGLTAIFIVITLIFFALWIYQAFIGPVGTNPAPNIIFLLMFLVFAFIAATFNTLAIEITSEFISVGYGIFRRQISWEKIEDCYPDDASAVIYGGWGIRFGRFKGKWRLIYDTVGSPRVVLLLTEGRFREFVFSTKNPHEVIELVKEHIL